MGIKVFCVFFILFLQKSLCAHKCTQGHVGICPCVDVWVLISLSLHIHPQSMRVIYCYKLRAVWYTTATASFAHTAAGVPGASHKFEPNNYLQCSHSFRCLDEVSKWCFYTVHAHMHLVFSNFLPERYSQNIDICLHLYVINISTLPSALHGTVYTPAHWATEPLSLSTRYSSRMCRMLWSWPAFRPFFIKPIAKFLLWICLCHQATVWQTLTLRKRKC